jgi:hypothetical protein
LIVHLAYDDAEMQAITEATRTTAAPGGSAIST